MSDAGQKKIHCTIVEVPEGEVRDTDYSFAKEALEVRRNHQPPISTEQMKSDLEREVVLYALEQLRDQGLIGQTMYENAVNIALKKLNGNGCKGEQLAIPLRSKAREEQDTMVKSQRRKNKYGR